MAIRKIRKTLLLLIVVVILVGNSLIDTGAKTELPETVPGQVIYETNVSTTDDKVSVDENDKTEPKKEDDKEIENDVEEPKEEVKDDQSEKEGSDELIEDNSEKTLVEEGDSSSTTNEGAQQDVEVISEESVGDAPRNSKMEANSTTVSTYAELKALIESKGNNGVYNYFYLTANLVGNGPIKVPSGYSFTIDGRNPENPSTIHSYQDYKSADLNYNISYTYPTVPNTMIMKNIVIKGENYYGPMYSSANSTMIYENVDYTGPQIGHNTNGTIIFRDSKINSPASGFYSASQEVAEARHVILEGTVDINHATSSAYPTFALTNGGSLKFEKGSHVSAKTNQIFLVVNNGQVNFEEDSTLVLGNVSNTIPKYMFHLQGTSVFNMKKGSDLQVSRMTTSADSSQVIYGLTSNVNMRGSSFSYTGKTTMSSFGLFYVNNVVFDGVKYKIDVTGDISGGLTYTPVHPSINNSTFDINASGSILANTDIYKPYFRITTTAAQTISVANTVFNIKALSADKSVLRASQMSLSNVEVNIEARPYGVKNSVFHATDINKFENIDINIDIYGYIGDAVVEGNIKSPVTDSRINVKSETYYDKNTNLLLRSTGDLTIKNTDLNVSFQTSKTGFDEKGTMLSAGGKLTLADSNFNVKLGVGAKDYFKLIINGGTETEIINSTITYDQPTRDTPAGGLIKNTGPLKVTNSKIYAYTRLSAHSMLNVGDLFLNDSQMYLETGHFQTEVAMTTPYAMIGNFDSKNSSFEVLLRYNNTTLYTLLEMTGDRFNFEGGDGHRMSLYAAGLTPGRTLIVTRKPARFTITAQQANFWKTEMDVGEIDGFVDYPKSRYFMNDGSNGKFDFTYQGELNTESFTWNENTFNHPNAPEPTKPLSFKMENTNIFAVGNMSFTVNKLTNGMTAVDGMTQPDADVRVAYYSNGIKEAQRMVSNENGYYRFDTKPLDLQNIEIEAYKRLLYSLDSSVTVIDKEVLHFGILPEDISFGLNGIPSKNTIINRVDPSKVQIVDKRQNGAAWKLELKVVSELEEKNGKTANIKDGLIYREGTVNTPLLLNEPVEIARGNADTSPEHMITWAVNEGILLNIKDPSKLMQNTTYSARIQWILTDLK